jgi:hypothetical protein
MTVSIYTASVPVLKQMLGGLSGVLTKAAANAAERKIDPSVFIAARLAPDMFALARQVQIATDMAKGGIARLAGVEIPKYEDTETTLEALQERLAKTIAFIESVPAASIEGTDDKTIVITAGQRELTFTGQAYLLSWVLPNVIFHVTTAYDILRHNGVPVGKRDFLGLA